MGEDIKAFKKKFKDFTKEDIIEGLYYSRESTDYILRYCKNKLLIKLCEKEKQLMNKNLQLIESANKSLSITDIENRIKLRREIDKIDRQIKKLIIE